MLDHIIRRFSPCGTRIVVHDLNTGDVWVADLQRPGSQRDDALAMAARWEEGEQPTSPPTRGRKRRRAKGAPALTLI